MKKKSYYGVHGYQMSWKTAKLDNFISGQEILIYQIQERCENFFSLLGW